MRSLIVLVAALVLRAGAAGAQQTKAPSPPDGVASPRSTPALTLARPASDSAARAATRTLARSGARARGAADVSLGRSVAERRRAAAVRLPRGGAPGAAQARRSPTP